MLPDSERKSSKRRKSTPETPGDARASSEFDNVVAPGLPGEFSGSLLGLVADGRTSYEALLAVFTKLEEGPHVKTKAVSTPREQLFARMIELDKLLEATQAVHAEWKRKVQSSTWERAREDNFAVLDGRCEDDGTPITDGCGICGVPRTECMQPDEHFGARGESPPDAKCPFCPKNFHNFYNSHHKLDVHVANKHAGMTPHE